MRLLNGVLGSLPSHLSCFGAGEDAINRPYTGGDSPPFIYPDGEPPVDMSQLQSVLQTPSQQPVDMTELQNILQPATTSYLTPAQEPYTYSGPGEEAEYAQAYATGAKLTADQQRIAATYGITAPGVSAAGVPQIAVQPSTSAQIINLVNTVAKGLLDVQKTQAQTKMSTAQAAALAEASKVQAQNYVMQQLQQGRQVMVPESWLQKYGASDTLTKWLTPILIIGGVGLLAYAAYLYTRKRGTSPTKSKSESATTVQGLGSVPTSSLSEADASMAAANPRRRGRKRSRR